MNDVTERARVLVGIALGLANPAAANLAASKEAWKVLSKVGDLFASVSTPNRVLDPVVQRTELSHMPAMDYILPPQSTVRVTFEDGEFVLHRVQGQSIEEIHRVRFPFDIGGHFVSNVPDKEVAPIPGGLMPQKPVELVLLEAILSASSPAKPGKFIASF